MEADRTDGPALILTTKVLGIELQLARSWLAGFVGTAAAYAWFAHALIPDVTFPVAVIHGAGVSVALTLSLLLHELAHARAAIEAGIGIEHIRIFAGGALVRRRDHIDEARDQFKVAAAGPVTSAALGLSILVVVVASDIAGWHSGLNVALWFIAFANGLIAVSNMLPVFPFDGGKLVYAMFWHRTRDRQAATTRLRQSGREFSRIVLALGLITMAMTGQVLIGLVIAAFGWYLLRLPGPPD
ncbi:MAG TPA: site-2 protease family protein [Longimicrobiales bacterium]|nr:site-2 protease family protein [Longimicrobiales bacterium]